MLDGKLRIAPTCYHVLHLVPVMTAHEMNYFYDEGLRNADDGLATGFEDLLREEKAIGDLNYDVSPIRELRRKILSKRRSMSCARDRNCRKNTPASAR